MGRRVLVFLLAGEAGGLGEGEVHLGRRVVGGGIADLLPV